jgi:hypothetical protein
MTTKQAMSTNPNDNKIRKLYDEIRSIRKIIYNDKQSNTSKQSAYEKLEELEKLQKEYSKKYPINAAKELDMEIQHLSMTVETNKKSGKTDDSIIFQLQKLKEIKEINKYINERKKRQIRRGTIRKLRDSTLISEYKQQLDQEESELNSANDKFQRAYPNVYAKQLYDEQYPEGGSRRKRGSRKKSRRKYTANHKRR